MDEHHDPSPVELGEEPVEPRISEVVPVVVAQQHDTVETQVVEGVGQLHQRGIDVGQGEGREGAEAPWMVRDRRGADLVRPASQLPGHHERAGDFRKVHPGCGDREHGGSDPVRVHDSQRRSGIPLRQPNTQSLGDTEPPQCVGVLPRDGMVVNINSTWQQLHRPLPRCAARVHGSVSGPGGRQACSRAAARVLAPTGSSRSRELRRATAIGLCAWAIRPTCREASTPLPSSEMPAPAEPGRS
jgi:hypothetical protein